MNKKTTEKIEELVETTINGNSIKNNEYYTNLLNRIKKDDIVEYFNQIQNDYNTFENICGTKFEMIDHIAYYFKERGV